MSNQEQQNKSVVGRETPQEQSPAGFDLDPENVEFTSEELAEFYKATKKRKRKQSTPTPQNGVKFED